MDDVYTNNSGLVETGEEDPEVQGILANSAPVYSSPPAASGNADGDDWDSEIKIGGAEEAQNPDFMVTVNEPQQEGDGVLSSHASYNISVSTTKGGFSGEFSVRRRFSEFVWLHNELQRSSPGYLIPPVPEGSVIAKFLGKFEASLLGFRARELERFLRRVVRHPILQNSSELRDFLNTDKAVFEEAKAPKVKSTATKVTSALGGWFGSAKNAVVQSVPQLGGAVEEADEWFERTTAYINALQVSLTAAANAFQGYADAVEGELPALRQCVEGALVMSKAESLRAQGDKERLWQEAAATLKAHYGQLRVASAASKVELQDVLFDYVRYLDAVQLVLKHRWKAYVDFKGAERTLESKRGAKSVKQQDMEAAENTEAQARENFERVSSTTREEIERFLEEKKAGIQRSLTQYNKLMFEYHQSSASIFKGFSEKFE